MKKIDNRLRYKMLIHDIAESVSLNEEEADIFFKEETINIDQYVIKGIKHINSNISLIKKTAKKTNTNNLFFKRVVLAAEIASNLHDEPTFGHVKFQKLVYLGEKLCELELRERYSKQAAGPFDRKFMHSVDNEFKRQKWFEVNLINYSNYSKYKYIPLDRLKNYKKYYQNYYSGNNENIQWLIEIFRNSKTDNVELVATIYACLEEIIENKLKFTIDVLFEKFYNWSDKKKNFSKDEIIATYEWMRDNELIPNS